MGDSPMILGAGQCRHCNNLAAEMNTLRNELDAERAFNKSLAATNARQAQELVEAGERIRELRDGPVRIVDSMAGSCE